MSLIPFILDLADELHEINRSLVTGMDVDDFGFGMYPQELHQTRRPRTVSQFYLLPNSKARHHPYYRGGKACCNKAASQLHDPEKDSGSPNDKESIGIGNGNGTATGGGTGTGAAKPAAAAYSVVNKNGFQVSMNVKQFSPNELTVKTIENCIIVEGKHDEKEDGHGVISRHFVRKYILPKGFDPNDVLSTLSSDGILTVKAPPPPTKAEEQQHERVVHIQHTGPAQLSVKDNSGKEKVTAPQQQQQQQQQPTAAALPAQTPSPLKPQTPMSNASQQQQPPQPPQHSEEQQKPSQALLQVPKERNGDANANELSAEQETEMETETETAVAAGPTAMEPMLTSSILATAPLDAVVSASTAPAVAASASAAITVTGAGEGVGVVSGGGGGGIVESDNGVADIPMSAVSLPVDVAAAIEAVPDGAAIESVLSAGDDGGADVVGVGIGLVGDLPAENIVIPTPPTAGDLVAAADAAILLAKTQCENGNNGNKSALDEMAN